MRQPYRIPAGGRYGAPMGRADKGVIDPDSRSKRVHMRRVPLPDGYDPGGAYWGRRINGESLYCAWHRSGWVRWIDAKSYLFAEEVIRQDFPDAEFGA